MVKNAIDVFRFKEKKLTKKFLIIKTSALGDTIHTYPVVDYLYHKFPGAQIDWVVEGAGAELIQTHPRVSRVILVSTKQWWKHPFNIETWKSIWASRKELRKEYYDAAFDLQGNTKSGVLLSQVRSLHKVGFGSKSVPEWPNLLFTNHKINFDPPSNIRENNVSIVSKFFGEDIDASNGTVLLNLTNEQRTLLNDLSKVLLAGPSLKVMICPGSAWSNKQLTPETLSKFLTLLEKSLHCTFLFVWGSKEELVLAEELKATFSHCSHIVDKMRIPMLQNLMDKCDLVISMDSMALHLAGTTTVPTFSIFGPSLDYKFKPIGKEHESFQGHCPYGRTFTKRCPILRSCPTGACIHDLPARLIFEKFDHWWKTLKTISHDNL